MILLSMFGLSRTLLCIALVWVGSRAHKYNAFYPKEPIYRMAKEELTAFHDTKLRGCQIQGEFKKYIKDGKPFGERQLPVQMMYGGAGRARGRGRKVDVLVVHDALFWLAPSPARAML